MRRWRASLAWAALLVVTLALASPPLALAQSQALQTASLATGLEAQYRAAIIRERRLADDRELRLITETETRMRDARHALANATADIAVARETLDACRADYVRAVNAVSLREASTRIEVEAFRAEIQGRLPQAAPELAAAYREFADGDRASAWTTLEALLSARAHARVAAARAVAASEVRQLASLREIMRSNGEATLADVLALWDQAADLDPTDGWTQHQRALLAFQLGDLPRARRAAETGMRDARDERLRSMVRGDYADVLKAQGDLRGAHDVYVELLARARMTAAAKPTDLYLQHDIAIALSNVTIAEMTMGNLSGAIEKLQEQLDIMRRLAAANFEIAHTQGGVGATLRELSIVHYERGDTVAAASEIEESVSILRALIATNPALREARVELNSSLSILGDVRLQQGRFLDARSAYEEALQLARAFVAADPTNASDQEGVASDLDSLAKLLSLQGDSAGALTASLESAAIRRRLIAADPTDASAMRSLSVVLDRIGSIQIDRRDWAAAAATYGELLANSRTLAAVSPENQQLQRDISTGLLKRGQALGMQGDSAANVAAQQESLAIARRLARLNPASTEAQRDVAISVEYLGYALEETHDFVGAMAAFRERQSIIQSLALADPSNAALQRDVALSHRLIGDAYVLQGGVPNAYASYLANRDALRPLITANPTDSVLVHDGFAVLKYLVSFTPSIVTWANVDTYVAAMQRAGLFTDADRDDLDQLRQRLEPVSPSKAFLDQVRARTGVEARPSGLLLERRARGVDQSLPRPTASARVLVHYEGKLIDGSVFDSSYARGAPVWLPLSQLVLGFAEAVQQMRPGDEVIATFPPELGYGARGVPATIPGDAPLQFRIQLLAVQEPEGSPIISPEERARANTEQRPR